MKSTMPTASPNISSPEQGCRLMSQRFDKGCRHAPRAVRSIAIEIATRTAD
jgi:hypothetical protein